MNLPYKLLQESEIMLKTVSVLYMLIQISVLFAQSEFLLQNTISVSLKKGLMITKVGGNLDYGDVLSTSSSQILTRDPEFGVNFEVNGITRQRISVDYSDNVVLDNSEWLSTNGGNLDDIEFIPNVRHTRGNSTYTGDRNLRDGRTIRLRNVGGIGKLFFWVGGDLEINSNQEIGEYKGTFTITVAY